VDDSLLLEELQTDKDLDGEPSDELLAEAVVVVADYQLVEVVAQ